MSHPIITVVGAMLSLTFSQWISIIQTIGLLFGGLWVAYTYWRFRKGQVSVGIEPAARLHRDPVTDEQVLLVRLRLRNSSNILFRYQTAAATLLDASQRTAEGDLQLSPFAEEDPLIPLFAEVSKDPAHIERGEVFDITASSGIILEPGEYADSELAFLLKDKEPGLMAMHVTVEGKQGLLGRRSFWWGSFFYIDPTAAPGALIASSPS